ncbi:MAG: GPO family capsid scaffolding protein [Colwellia sp.]
MLTTEFLTIGTAGATVDGRTIQEQWLTDCAESYDPEIYTATINGEHQTWYGCLGTVHSLRLGKNKQGKTTLEAELRPNYRLIQFNMAGQKLFTSMEIEPKFSDTGKAYLEGLAVTDNPASLSTTMLQLFSKDKSDKALSEPFEFSLGIDGGEPMPNPISKDDEKTMFKKFMAYLKGEQTEFKNQTIEQDDDVMTQAQFEALEKLHTEQAATSAAAFTVLTQAMTAMAEKFTAPDADDNNPEADQSEETETQKLSALVENLTKQVADLSQEIPPKFSGDNLGDETTTKEFI